MTMFVLYAYTCACIYAYRWMPEKGTESPGAGDVGCYKYNLTWLLKIKSEFPAKSSKCSNQWAIPQVPLPLSP